MADARWKEVWRGWLRARFGGRLDAATLEAAVEGCEALRALWAPLLRAQPDPAELPFPNPLPAPEEDDAP